MDLISFIQQAFAQYGYGIVFLGAFFESVILLGFIIPGSFIVLFGGYFAKLGHSSLYLTIFLAFLGMFLGDLFNYFLGRVGFSRVITKSPRLTRMLGKDATVSIQLEKYGMIAIFYSHILGTTRSLICFTAGSVRYPFRTFLVSSFIASSLWGIIFVGIGYFMGSTVEGLQSISIRLAIIAWIGVLVILVLKLAQNFILKRIGNKN